MKKVIFNFISLLFVIYILLQCVSTEKKETTTTITTTTVYEVTTTTTVVKVTMQEQTTTITTTTTILVSATTTTIDKRLDFTLTDKTTKDELRRHMNNLFTAIEDRIASADFDAWYNVLTTRYKNYLNDQNILKKLSEESDYLLNRGIVLKSPKDFFRYVVIPAREGRKLKFYDYEKIDNFHVKVICLLDESIKFVYNFTYENDSWKLDR